MCVGGKEVRYIGNFQLLKGSFASGRVHGVTIVGMILCLSCMSC